MADIQTLRRILKAYHTIAVVGLSGNWYRPSFFAAKYLQDHGYRIIPVNPNYEEILGETCYPDLASVPDQIDIVEIFQRPEKVPPLVDEAIRLGAKVVWMQIGIEHAAAEESARNAGLEVVVDRCMKIEYARLFGGLNFIGVDTQIISSKRPMRVPY